MFDLKKRAYIVYKHYIAILIIATVATVIGVQLTMKLRLESDLAQLLPDSFESVKALNRIKEEVGAVGHLRIVLESSDFQAMKRLANDLAPRLQQNPLVKYVDYKNDVDFYETNALLFMDMDELQELKTAVADKINEEKQKLNPLYVEDLFGDDGDEVETDSGDKLTELEQKYEDKVLSEYYTNADSTVLVMKVFPTQTNTSIKFVRKMVNAVEGIVQEAHPERYADDMKVYYGGNFKNRLDEYQVIKKDILGTAYYGFGGVFLLIVLYFRRLTGAILITITLLFALAWTFGVTYLVVGNLNTITGFLFVILFGMGIDYGIHALARYIEGRKRGKSFEESIETMVGQTGKALTTTALTTSAAFFSLVLMDFKGFSDLGIITGIGILFALVAMVVVLPAFLTLAEKLQLLRIKPGGNGSATTHKNEFRFARPILWLTGVFTLLAIFYISRVQFEYDFTNLRAITKEREIVSEKTRGVFKLSESPAVILADSREEVDEIVQKVKQIIKQDTLTPTVDEVRSIFSLVPPDQEQKLQVIRSIREMIERDAEGVVKGKDKERLDKLMKYLQVKRPFTWDEFPEKDKRQFIDKSGKIGNFVFIYPSVPLRDGRNAIEFRNDIGKITTASGHTYYASSSNIIFAEMLLIMMKEGRLAAIVTFAVVFLVVFADFRSLRATILVLTPLVLGVIWMIGLMGMLGMKLNFFNMVVLPSVMGIGVDNGVHIYHRYVEEGRCCLMHVIRNTGLAIAMTTSTTIMGYSGLIMAHHPGLNSIGKLAVIGITATFLTAIVVLPAILQSPEKRVRT